MGAWAWKEVVPPLEKRGHAAFAVTLAGMGDRVYLATKDVGMETAIQDVPNVIKHNDIFEVLTSAQAPITLVQIHKALVRVMGREAPNWEAF